MAGKKNLKRGGARGKAGGQRVGKTQRLEDEARATFLGGDDDEEVSSDSDADFGGDVDVGEEAPEETVEAARLRHARAYLDEVRAEDRASRKARPAFAAQKRGGG